MPTTNQSGKQQSARDQAGTTSTWNGDLMAAFQDVVTGATGGFNQRLYSYLVDQLSPTTITSLQGLMTAYAQANGVHNWDSLNFLEFFAPDTIPNLVLWMDASQTDTITDTANLVSEWDDLSTNAFVMEQTVGANQPLTNTTTINSLNTVDYDGTDDFTALQNSADVDFDRTDPYTFIWIADHPTIATIGTIAAKQPGVGSLQGYNILKNADGSVFFLFNSATAGNAINIDGTNSMDGVTIPMLRYDGSSAGAGVDFFIDGVEDTLVINQDTLTLPTSNTGLLTFNVLTFGGSPFLPAGIDMGEFLVYDRALTEMELNLLGNYLADKWGQTWNNIPIPFAFQDGTQFDFQDGTPFDFN